MDGVAVWLVARRELQRLIRDRTFWVLFFFQVLMVAFAQLIVHSYAMLLFPSEAGSPMGGWEVGVVSHGQRTSPLADLLADEGMEVVTYGSLVQAQYGFIHGEVEAVVVPPVALADLLPAPLHIGMTVIHDNRSLRSIYTANRLEEALVDISHRLGFERLVNYVGTVPQVRVAGLARSSGSRPSTTARNVHSLYGFLIPFIFLFLAVNAGDILMELLSQDVETHKLEPLVHALSPRTVLRGKVGGAVLVALLQGTLYILLLLLQGVRLAHPLFLLGYAVSLAVLLAGVGLMVAALVPGRQEMRFAYFAAMSGVFIVNLTPLPLPDVVRTLVPSACMVALSYSPALEWPQFLSAALLLGVGIALVRLGEEWFTRHPEALI